VIIHHEHEVMILTHQSRSGSIRGTTRMLSGHVRNTNSQGKMPVCDAACTNISEKSLPVNSHKELVLLGKLQDGLHNSWLPFPHSSV